MRNHVIIPNIQEQINIIKNIVLLKRNIVDIVY